MKNHLLLFAFAVSSFCFAQQSNTHDSDIMYKKEITRAVDLREPQNKSLFARGHEITRLLLEALKAGEITAYSSDSLTNKTSKEEVFELLEIPSNIPPIDTAYITDPWEKQQAIERLKNYKPDTYSAQDLYQLEIKETILFDKKHSVMEQQIKALTLFIPAGHPDNLKGIQLPIASFDYAECRNLFSHNPNAIWYNPQNDQEHKNLADAFDLRLFSSYIIKVSNPDNHYLVDIYGDGKAGIIAAENASLQLLEFESYLWEQ